LKAFHQSGSVVIEVSDDGAGIALERVLEKAVERRLVTAEQAAGMSEREALQLIFLAGFSTAAAVTTVSGRGVGMDVVRANVERVGGSVEVESRLGVGTTLRMRVPLTLAIVPSLVVRSGGQSFAVPQSALVELVDLPVGDAARVVERIGSAEVYRLRDHLLPMVWLDRLLGLARCESETRRGHYMAVLEAEGCRYGLVVDDLVSPEEIVVKPLSAVLREIGLFSGATVLGNGTLALILDIGAAAARAGVRPVEEEMVELKTMEPAVKETGDVSLLIFEDRLSERTALLLEVVERIESVPLKAIEYAGGRPLLQYRGELLRLRDDGRVLDELKERQAGDETATLTVLICRDAAQGRGQRAGMVVRQVLDVSQGRLVERGAADAVNGMTVGTELAVVNERLTVVHREFEVGDAAWREVA
jgi:two-component system, chemotaxis family, sensor kinase CheA